MGLRQISCSFKSPSTETSVSYSCHSRYSCSLNLSSSRANRPYSCDSCSLNLHKQQRPRSLIRAIRDIRVPLTIQAAESHGLRVSFALLLPVDQWVYDKSRVRLPYTNFSPLFICTSFTNFLTSADESSFLHINSTLSSSATI